MNRIPKILLVTEHSTKEKNGPALRLIRTVHGLQAVGELSIVYLQRDHFDIKWDESNVATIRVQRNTTGLGLLGWLASTYPRSARYKNVQQLRTNLSKFLDNDWDLIWLFRGHSYTLIADRHTEIPVVVDLDDLYDIYYKLIIDNVLPTYSFIKRNILLVAYKLEIKKWAKLQQKILNEVTAVGVTNAVDKQHLVQNNVTVLPNGYPICTETGRWQGKPFRILMVGGYHYPPNAVAAYFLAFEVFPLVKTIIPDAELILVGRPGIVTSKCFKEVAGVSFKGQVECVNPYYRAASAAMTVVQSGAGSRLKVIEAMAQKVPLVSTRFASQGFELTDSLDVLFAESAEEVFQCILKLQTNTELSDKLVNSAYKKYIENYEASLVESAVSSLADSTIKNCVVP